MNQLPRLYREDPQHSMPRAFLSDEVYSQAIEAFIVVCTDVLFIHRPRRSVFLAKRAVYAMKGWWTIGGRSFAGEDQIASVRRCVEREVRMNFPADRFEFICMNRYLCSRRQQEPQDKGGDYLAYVFALDLSDREWAAASQSLDRAEYEPGVGLVEFQRSDLLTKGVPQVIIDLYDQVFPATT